MGEAFSNWFSPRGLLSGRFGYVLINLDRSSKDSTKRVVVGAIDFGTTYSGWAFSFLHDYASHPTRATVKHWNSKSGVLTTEKTPTCILIGPNKKFLAFGYEAENMYRDLTDEGTHRMYYYFRRFKMILNKKLGETLDRFITLEDEMGRTLPAVDIFSMAIKYLVEDMLVAGNDTIAGDLQETDVHWVLTVPAIWTDGAKNFMRLAAERAGIGDDRLSIALEPEAASIYCRHLGVEKSVDKSVAQFQAGVKYMVVDSGGGTVDITVHEVTSGGQVKEVQPASGGGWGGILVDKAFEDLIKEIFRHDVYEKFKKTETEDWLDLWRDFEVKKRSVSPYSTARITMKFPLSLMALYEESTGVEIKDAVANSSYADDIEVGRDKIKFDAKIFKKLFSEPIEKIVGHVKNVLEKIKVNAVLMVGGFSESPMLQNAIKSQFAGTGIDVVIPQGASSTILRGALIFGHCPKSIEERVLKYSYGVAISMPFIEGVHPERHRVVTDNGSRCKNIFHKHVEKNQTVKVGEPQVKQNYSPTAKFQRFITLQIYASYLQDPKYVDEGCTSVGKLEIEIADPDEDLTREIEVSLTFSGTEIVVDASDTRLGIKYATKVDYLE